MKIGLKHIIATCLILAGCSSTSGVPRTSLDPKRDLASIVVNKTLDVAKIEAMVAAGNTSKQARNEIIQARLAEIDILYFEYENNLSKDIRGGNFTSTFANVLLGGVGAVATGAVSKNLSALSGVLAGSKAAYDRDFLLDQSLQAVVSQMRANRAVVKSRIIARLAADPATYTLQGALSDLAEYQQAGTMAAAMAGITHSAQTEEISAKSSLRNAEDKMIVTRNPIKTTKKAVGIRDWVRAGVSAADRQTRLSQVSDCFDKNKPAGFEIATAVEFLPQAGTSPELESAILSCLALVHGVKF